MQQNQKSVPEHALNTSKVSLLNYAKTKLSFQEDTGPIKIRDPKGEALFHAKFIPKFEAGYDAWVKAGNDPWAFLTQENIDKLANGLRSKAEMARDRMNALGESTGEKGADTMPPAPEGIDKTVWNTVLAHPPVMATGQVATHAQYGKAIATLKDNPTPEMMAKFDKWFGTDKVKAKDVLGQLGGKPAETLKSENEAAAYERLPPPPNYSIHDTKGPGPAGYLGDVIRGIVPQKAQDYLKDKATLQ